MRLQSVRARTAKFLEKDRAMFGIFANTWSLVHPLASCRSAVEEHAQKRQTILKPPRAASEHAQSHNRELQLDNDNCEEPPLDNAAHG